MKNLPLLLGVVVLGSALWLLFGADTDEAQDGLDGTDYLPSENGGGPGLKADGREPEGPATNGGVPDAPPNTTTSGVADATLVGRVVDDRRVPVAGAQVQLGIGARVLGRAETDADGRYTLGVPASARGSGVRLALVARTEDRRAGTASAWLDASGAREQKLPVIVLRAAHDLQVHVVREGGGVMGAQVAAVHRGAGVPLLLASENGDEDGRVLLRGLPPGPLELFATAPGHGRARTTLRVPRAENAGPALLELQAERVLTVYVYDAQSQRPVRGAELLLGDTRTMPIPHGPGYLPSLPPARTDRRGYAVIRRLGADETIYVNARAAGYAFAPWWHARTQMAAPGVEEVRVPLARARRVRFPVIEDTVPTPPDGTVINVESRGAARDTGGAGLTAVIEDGDVIVTGLGAGGVAGTLIAPSGALATFMARAGSSEGQSVTFRLPRTVRVRVVERGGAAVADLPLRLRAGGRAPAVDPAVTDAEGLAVFTGVGGDRAVLHRDGPGVGPGGPPLATLDLTLDVEVHDVVLEPAIELVLTTRIEGSPRLPAEYALMAGGARLGAARIDEDPTAGELRCLLRPPASDSRMRVQLHARGYLVEELDVDPRESSVRETIDLRPAGRLLVRVEPPEDGSYTLRLQRYDTDREDWMPARIPTARSALGAGRDVASADGMHVYEGLAPGRYRAFERGSRRASEEIEVGLGAEVELRLDLSGARWVRGRVIGPPGARRVQARVLVDGPAGGVWSGVRPDGEGRFRIRADRDQPVTLRVTHPTLMPAARGGRVRLAAGTDEVELRLESGPELSFRVSGYEDAQTPASGLWHAPFTVHLLPKDDSAGERLSAQPVADSGTFRLGGFKPGVYTLWLTFGRTYAPYVREGVQLGTQSLDLGTIRPSTGTTLRVRVAGLAERPGAAVWAVVSHEGEPAYTRHGSLDREAGELVSRGLGAGRFRVVVRGAGLAGGSSAARILLETVVTADGSSERTLDVQLP